MLQNIMPFRSLFAKMFSIPSLLTMFVVTLSLITIAFHTGANPLENNSVATEKQNILPGNAELSASISTMPGRLFSTSEKSFTGIENLSENEAFEFEPNVSSFKSVIGRTEIVSDETDDIIKNEVKFRRSTLAKAHKKTKRAIKDDKFDMDFDAIQIEEKTRAFLREKLHKLKILLDSNVKIFESQKISNTFEKNINFSSSEKIQFLEDLKDCPSETKKTELWKEEGKKMLNESEKIQKMCEEDNFENEQNYVDLIKGIRHLELFILCNDYITT